MPVSSLPSSECGVAGEVGKARGMGGKCEIDKEERMQARAGGGESA